MIIYGIKNCDTMKKAFTWLNEHRLSYTFHDYKAQGITSARIEKWLEHIPLSVLINTKGTTFRNLPQEQKVLIADTNAAIRILTENTSMIKRPVLETPEGVIAGFDPKRWAEILAKP